MLLVIQSFSTKWRTAILLKELVPNAMLKLQRLGAFGLKDDNGHS
jgi:hypothetical protein